MSLSREEAARRLGMKVAEVVKVEEGPAGTWATTHDGVRTLLATVEPAAELEPADEVPDGAVGEVLTWVGDDSARARAALKVEQAKPKPRTGLVFDLRKLAGSA